MALTLVRGPVQLPLLAPFENENELPEIRTPLLEIETAPPQIETRTKFDDLLEIETDLPMIENAVSEIETALLEIEFRS